MKKTHTAVMLTVLMVILVTGGAMAAPKNQSVTVKLDGKNLDWNRSPVIVDGHTMVPMEEFLKSLQSQVWDRVTDKVKNYRGNLGVASVPGSDDWLSGELIWLEVPTLLIDGKLYMPLRFMAEAMGAEVRWDAKAQMVIMEFPQVKPPSKPPASNPVNVLKYTILHSDDDLYLIVKNPTAKPVRATFPTGQTHDFALIDKNGKTVWKDSEGRMFTQARREETIPAGQSRVYHSTIPTAIPAGTYTVEAYFPPAGAQQVASAKIEIVRPNQASRLTYQLSFRPAGVGIGNNYNRLAFQILNRTGEDIEIEYPEAVAYRILIKDSGGKIVWDRSIPRTGSLREAVPNGSSRYHFARMPELAAGKYTAEAYFPPAGDQPAAKVSFTLR